VAKHRTCPGHAAAVIESSITDSTADDGYEAAYLCLDPIGNGHVPSMRVTEKSQVRPTPVKRRSVMIRVLDRGAEGRAPPGGRQQQAWTRREVRRAFVTELLHRRTTPKGTLRFVTETLLSDPAVATSGDDRDLDKVLGHQQPRDGDWWARPAARRCWSRPRRTPAAMLLLAQVVAGIEATTGRS